MAVLLDVKNLETQFKTEAGLVKAVDGSLIISTNRRLSEWSVKAAAANRSASSR